MSDYESVPSTGEVVEGSLEDYELPKEQLIKIVQDIINNLATQEEDFSPEESLGYARETLEDLKSRFPNDPDIYLFEQALSDLESDFREGRETELDESMDQLMMEMRGLINEAGVRQRGVAELLEEDSLLGETLRRIQVAGVRPEYVVESIDPGAPIIIIFMQVHPLPEGAENVRSDQIVASPEIQKAFQVKDGGLRNSEESQSGIYRDVDSLVKNGVGKVLYAEALPGSMELSQGAAERASGSGFASIELKKDLGDDILVKAYDAYELKMATLRGELDFIYRFSSQNVYIASNLASIHPGGDEQPVSFATIGGFHEQYPNQEVQHQIPISQAMAYYGFNVIVVDEAFN